MSRESQDNDSQCSGLTQSDKSSIKATSEADCIAVTPRLRPTLLPTSISLLTWWALPKVSFRIYWSIWKWFRGRNCEGTEKRGNYVHRMLANNWLSTSIIKSIPKLKVQILQKKWQFSRFMRRIPETVLINSSSLISLWLLKVPWTSAIFPSYIYDTQNILLWIIVICGLVYFSVIKWASKSWWLSIRALRSELV